MDSCMNQPPRRLMLQVRGKESHCSKNQDPRTQSLFSISWQVWLLELSSRNLVWVILWDSCYMESRKVDQIPFNNNKRPSFQANGHSFSSVSDAFHNREGKRCAGKGALPRAHFPVESIGPDPERLFRNHSTPRQLSQHP